MITKTWFGLVIAVALTFSCGVESEGLSQQKDIIIDDAKPLVKDEGYVSFSAALRSNLNKMQDGFVIDSRNVSFDKRRQEILVKLIGKSDWDEHLAYTYGFLNFFRNPKLQEAVDSDLKSMVRLTVGETLRPRQLKDSVPISRTDARNNTFLQNGLVTTLKYCPGSSEPCFNVGYGLGTSTVKCESPGCFKPVLQPGSDTPLRIVSLCSDLGEPIVNQLGWSILTLDSVKDGFAKRCDLASRADGQLNLRKRN